MVANLGFQRRAFSGWNDYRYGPKTPVTLAGQGAKPKPLVTGAKRKHLISEVMDFMRDWRQSPFEDEGGMIAALRSAWCIKGYDWRRSDHQAREIVSEALRLLGAKRPSWDQGQRWYGVPRDNCVVCGSMIEDPPSTRAVQFCSAGCAQLAREKMNFERRNGEDKLYAAAQRVILRSRTTARKCAWCGTAFHPISEKSKQEHCSITCANKRQHIVYPVVVREITCTCCGKAFSTKSGHAAYCSKACRTLMQSVRHGHLPKKLTATSFDWLFHRIRQEVRRPALVPANRVTAEIFDGWFNAG